MPGKFNAFGPAFCERGTCKECDVLRARGKRELGFFFAALVAACALMFLLASQAHAQVVLGGPVDAGAEVPLYAHVDAGEPSPLTGMVLNEPAQRNLLATCTQDAGAPVEQPQTSDATDTALHIALVVVTAASAIYLHQRATH